MEEGTVVKPAHVAVKGRARFEVAGLRGSNALRDHLTGSLSKHETIIEASVSAMTGKVLVRFNSGNDFKTIAALIESLVREYTESGAGAPVPAVSIEPRSSGGPRDAGSRPQSRFAAGSGGEEQKEAPWHTMSAEAAALAVGASTATGLSEKAAGERLGQFGPNALPEAEARSGWSIFIDQFKSLPVALLGVAAGISVATGGLADAVVIVAVVAINGAIGYFTESEAEKTIGSLKDMVKPTADVWRNSAIRTIQAREVVPGDMLVLRPGSYVTADARIVEAGYLSLDESVLTGESMPVVKSTEPLAGADIPLGDRINMVYMGTLVTGGQGIAVAVATGRYTEVGKLQALVGEADAPETPLEQQLNKLGDQLVLISGAACGLVFGIGLLRGFGFMMILKLSISLAVAAVPEGLPAVATTTLALGVRKMRRSHVLIRHLDAIETLGCIRTICFDKTGTITHNRMTVVRMVTGMREIRATDGAFLEDGAPVSLLGSEEAARLIQACVLCNETQMEDGPDGHVLRGSATEIALINMAFQAGVNVAEVRARNRLVKLNYRSESRLFMGSLHEFEHGGERGLMIAMKGSPVDVLAMCDWQIYNGEVVPLTEDDRSRIEMENDRMAGDALRVLGVAHQLVESEQELGTTSGFVWLGLVGMADPVRPGVSALIKQFHRAGIATVMITGDQGPTAYAIGKELDLSCGEPLEILDSTELAQIDPETLTALADKVHVFARVSPAFKLEIVRAIQRKGGVVAMTGDGINDGPALKAADIGIAMGQGGTDLAREVADMVLEEDNLETVIIAVRDGRTIHNNIRKTLRFLLATNFSEIAVMLIAVASGLPSPLNAMQLLWINLLSDIFPGLALAMEQPEPDILDRPPRAPGESIVKTEDFKRLAFESSTLSLGAMAAYGYGIARHGVGPLAGTMAFQSLTMGQLLHAISCRSENHSIFSGDRLPSNRYLNIALGGSFALQAMTFFVPGLRGFLGLAPIGLLDGAVIAGAAVLPLVTNELTKPSCVNKEKAAESAAVMDVPIFPIVQAGCRALAPYRPKAPAV